MAGCTVSQYEQFETSPNTFAQEQSLKWQLTFNAAKCTHMTYGNAKIKSKYKMKEGDGKVTDIRHDDEVEKDLGVLFDRKLSFR